MAAKKSKFEKVFISQLSLLMVLFLSNCANNIESQNSGDDKLDYIELQGGAVFDPLDFAPGSQFFQYAPDSIPWTNREGRCANPVNCVGYPTDVTQGVTIPTKNQMLSYANPRYKSGNTLPKNFNGMDNQYLAGRENYTDAEAQAATPVIVEEMAKNFNYGISLFIAGGYNPNSTGGPDRISQLAIGVANANPQYSVDMFTLWNAAGYNITSNSLPSSCYLKKADGSIFLTPYGSNFFLPTFSNFSGCADSLWQYDGNAMLGYINSYNMSSSLKGLASRPTPVNRIMENGEQFYPMGQWGTDADLEADPVAIAEYNRSGIPNLSSGKRNWQRFQAQWAQRIHAAYRDRLLASPLTANAKYTIYQNTGNSPYYYSWEEMRNLHFNYRNGARLSTLDYYPEGQSNWNLVGGAWHGMGFFYDDRYYEKQFGDHWNAPYVTAGWYYREEKNIRPGAYLGQLKLHLGLGSVYFHQEFFSLYAPFPDSRNWNWQMASASYAQGLLSYIEDFFYNSTTMDGDKILKGHPALNFNTNDPAKAVIVRKHNSQNKYLIVGTVQPNDNSAGTPVHSDASFVLNGQTLTIPVRKHGSVYILDQTNPAAPVFYQLDKWHESTHPAYWSRDFNIEAELPEQSIGASVASIKTEGVVGGDFRQANSYIRFASANQVLSYKFQPRANAFNNNAADNSYYVYLRMRNKGITPGTASLVLKKNGTTVTTSSISNITGTGWKLYRVEAQGAPHSLTNLSVGVDHLLDVSVNNVDVEIDSILLANDPMDTTAPTVSIISPMNGVTYPLNTTVSIQMQAFDNVGVTKVEIYRNGKLIRTMTGAPFARSFTFTGAGTKKLEAYAYDAAGNIGISQPVTITINP